MTELFIDIETYSATDLIRAGVYRYVEDPTFTILMAAWALDDSPVTVALGARDIHDIPGLWDPRVKKIAHNAPFERTCFCAWYCADSDIEEWHDTMAVAGERAYPQKLEQLAPALGATPKDTAGTRLINLFCKPNREGRRVTPEEKPQEWLDFIAYCAQDVETLREVHRALGDFPTEMERRVYHADQVINDTGIRVDTNMARLAVTAAEENQTSQVAEFTALTGVENPNSNPQVLTWVQSHIPDVKNLQAATVEKALRSDIEPDVRRALEIRQELALVASKKYISALEGVCHDGRLRGGFRFFGAHTGRWSGRGVQLHNLPRASFYDDEGNFNETAQEAAILDLFLCLGADAHTLKALVRALFVGPFTVVDYAAIEARVVAWLAGEEWALQAFRDGRDIYVETAQRMSSKGNTLTRAQGKVAVLALGYNGGIASLQAMGGKGTEQQLQHLVYQWRNANPAIVGLWKEMDYAFRKGDTPVGDRLYIERDGTDRLMRLPSGRSIVYHDVKPDKRMTFKNYRMNGVRTDTYGGRLTENATQAVARDILAEALVRLVDGGYRVVGHVHDEILVEGEHSVQEVTDIMTTPPGWAEGLPIDGEGFICRRYRKG